MYKIGEVSFNLIGTNGFHAKNERFTATGSCCRQKLNNSEFKKLRRQLQGKRHIKIERCVKFSLVRLFRVDHAVKIGGEYFRLLGANGFHVKAKSERFTAANPRCRQNLKYENFTSSFGKLRQNLAPKSVPHVQHDYFSLFNLDHHFMT